MATPSGGPAPCLPSTVSVPVLSSVRPAMQRRNVVLPQPLGPTMQRISSRLMFSESCRNATTVPSRNSLLAPSATMTESAPTLTPPLPSPCCSWFLASSRCCDSILGHDAEKCEAVFGKVHAQTRVTSDGSDSTKLNQALAPGSIPLHAARIGRGFPARSVLGRGGEAAFRPFRLDLDDVAAPRQLIARLFGNALLDLQHARPRGPRPERDREMLGMPG